MGKGDVLRAYDLDWRNDVSGVVVMEGSVIDVDGRNVTIYETPGHSSCSISAYVDDMKTLFS
jgi:glyoxylase-like metal-dependent hydrolase (beta-lactamase superfamily II)